MLWIINLKNVHMLFRIGRAVVIGAVVIGLVWILVISWESPPRSEADASIKWEETLGDKTRHFFVDAGLDRQHRLRFKFRGAPRNLVAYHPQLDRNTPLKRNCIIMPVHSLSLHDRAAILTAFDLAKKINTSSMELTVAVLPYSDRREIELVCGICEGKLIGHPIPLWIKTDATGAPRQLFHGMELERLVTWAEQSIPSTKTEKGVPQRPKQDSKSAQ